MRDWPAIDVSSASDPDQVIATVDDFSPTAVEEREAVLRLFFSSASNRDAALAVLVRAGLRAAAIEVSDEDWARRSQEGLAPVTVGRLTIVPSTLHRAPSTQHSLVIVPSMGFGTGHHATTRLCLKAMQEIDLASKRVLDVGTGSGILAIAASLLGASSAIGLDNDPDAIESAQANLTLNPHATHVRFALGDLGETSLPPSDLVTANLTGTLLRRAAPSLIAAVAPGGALIVSGVLEEEEAAVRAAFAVPLVWRHQEEEWVALMMKSR